MVGHIVSADETVVVIDDDLSVRRSLARLFASVGYEVIMCSSADEFLAMSSVPRPACLVTDVRMPGITGLDLLDLLGTRRPSLPIILISGDADPGVHARAAGAVRFLLKPFPSEDLLGAVAEALDRDRAELAREA
jgi:two-component system, LuxR family, response regulator FixJ